MILAPPSKQQQFENPDPRFMISFQMFQKKKSSESYFSHCITLHQEPPTHIIYAMKKWTIWFKAWNLKLILPTTNCSLDSKRFNRRAKRIGRTIRLMSA